MPVQSIKQIIESVLFSIRKAKFTLYRTAAFYVVALPSVISIIFNQSQEPLFSYRCLLLYLLKRDFFPFFNPVDFRRQCQFHKDGQLPCVIYDNEKYFFKNSWPRELIEDHFNGILNEQHTGSPHRYISTDEMSEEWVIYDIGASEGFQAKQWSKKIKKIIIFEPDKEQYLCLLKTFESELKSGKVEIINEGVSNEYKEVIYENEIIKLDSLDNLIKKFKLPLSHYIKADIEGEELHFLQGAEGVFKDKNIKIIQITTYHRPNDGHDIAQFFSKYPGTGEFSEGVTLVNRDGTKTVVFSFYHPIIRKCLYTFRFMNDT